MGEQLGATPGKLCYVDYNIRKTTLNVLLVPSFLRTYAVRTYMNIVYEWRIVAEGRSSIVFLYFLRSLLLLLLLLLLWD
jgi:hypothetical protein